MVVDQIAKERLTVNALARCSELIAVKVPPEKIPVAAVYDRRPSSSSTTIGGHRPPLQDVLPRTGGR